MSLFFCYTQYNIAFKGGSILVPLISTIRVDIGRGIEPLIKLVSSFLLTDFHCTFLFHKSRPTSYATSKTTP
jgi:hypothetical protein